jgi:hypothetical protein
MAAFFIFCDLPAFTSLSPAGIPSSHLETKLMLSACSPIWTEPGFQLQSVLKNFRRSCERWKGIATAREDYVFTLKYIDLLAQSTIGFVFVYTMYFADDKIFTNALIVVACIVGLGVWQITSAVAAVILRWNFRRAKLVFLILLLVDILYGPVLYFFYGDPFLLFMGWMYLSLNFYFYVITWFWCFARE